MADTLADYMTELNYNRGFFLFRPLKFLGAKFTVSENLKTLHFILITDALGKSYRVCRRQKCTA
jgi:hypothetical protein